MQIGPDPDRRVFGRAERPGERKMEYSIISALFDDVEKCGRIDLQVADQTRPLIVTRRSLLSVASPPRASEARLFQFLHNFCEIALAYRKCDPRHAETLVVTATDVRRWRRGHSQSEPLWTLQDIGSTITPFPRPTDPSSRLRASAETLERFEGA
ncbi:hypothetical protein [Rhizobium sp. 1399]|uniref:hypothetical protein n=1 Tax=Rhizobium sp. 1399 TaxID=2817758 RepID=UPI002854318C|nr:hypothetical protein [Rhizobium sp. 1399]MDR6671170.1 hypothetical protein [Rhizobium sp. 1399]